jgi:hypothetical protein
MQMGSLYPSVIAVIEQSITPQAGRFGQHKWTFTALFK